MKSKGGSLFRTPGAVGKVPRFYCIKGLAAVALLIKLKPAASASATAAAAIEAVKTVEAVKAVKTTSFAGNKAQHQWNETKHGDTSILFIQYMRAAGKC